MIDSHVSASRTARGLWSGYVQRLFQTLELHERPAAGEISESLAVFCEQHPHMPAHTLSLLMARTFCATGDREAAGRILCHDRAHRRHTAAWLDVLAAEYPFPELVPLFSSRTLRPLRLNSAGPVWVLDIDAVHLSEADRHELILFQTIRVLTEKVSNVWKKTDGRGTLGVKGLHRLTHFMRPRNTRAADRFFGHIHDVLARCAKGNGWNHVPSVLQIDL